MKWDPDKDIKRFEPALIPGTTFQRMLLDVTLARKEGLKIPEGKEDRDSINAWVLAIGCIGEPKHFVYGLTMRDCFLRLRRQVQRKQVDLNPQLFPRLLRKAKPKLRQRRKARKAER